MLLFGLATILAGAVAQDNVVTALGLVIVAVGLGLFGYRQVKHNDDESGTEAKAGIVTLKAPASLVAMVVGVVLVLVGRGALTLQATSDDSAAPQVAVTTTMVVASTTTTTSPATTTTTTAPLTPPAPPVDNGESVEPPLTELPMTGGEPQDFATLGFVMWAGGRWLTKASFNA